MPINIEALGGRHQPATLQRRLWSIIARLNCLRSSHILEVRNSLIASLITF